MRMLLFLLLIATSISTLGAETLGLRILHTNDLHGHVEATLMHGDKATVAEEAHGGLALLDAMLRRERSEALRLGRRCLYLDGGDMFQGTPVANATEGACMIRMANALHLLATTLGNHDFDYGLDALERRMEEGRFFWLGTTVSLPFATAQRRDSLSYWLHDRRGRPRVKLAFLGATTEETPMLTLKERIVGVRFNDVVKSLAPRIRRLRERHGVQVVVLLSHLGLEVDRRLLRQLPSIDLIVGGHSHTAMRHPERVGNSWIQQAGAHGNFLGRLDLRLDAATGRILAVDGTCLPVRGSDLSPTTAGTELADALTADSKGKMAEVVGELARDYPKGVRGGESPMAALCARAMREVLEVDLSIVNLGGVRTGLIAGPVTFGQAYQVFPFANTMVVGRMRGSELRSLLEEAVDGDWELVAGERKARYRELFGLDVEGYLPVERKRGHLYLGGLRYRFDPRRPEGRRITELLLDDGSPLDDGRSYRVVTNNFLAEGGDGFDRLASLEGAADRGLLDVDVLVQWLRRQKRVDALDTRGIVNESLVLRCIEGRSMPITRIR